jgi:hypothetical protein
MEPSRGYDIRNYIPAFAKGAKVTLASISAGFTTGITSAGITKSYIANGEVTSDKLSAKAVSSTKMNAAFLSGTLVSGQTTRSIAHGLGVKPKSVIVVPILTLAQAISAAVPSISLAAASAATSAVFYVIGSQPSNGAIKYAAYVQI